MSDDVKLPDDPLMCFAMLVSKCASGLHSELVARGKTDVQARNLIIRTFLDFASGEACRIARREGREPDQEKWRKATSDAFEQALARTAAAPTQARPADAASDTQKAQARPDEQTEPR